MLGHEKAEQGPAQAEGHKMYNNDPQRDYVQSLTNCC